MEVLWFVLGAFMLTMYVVLDGFDLGAGVIHLRAARTDGERRAILRAIGPVWDGNEVWLIAAAGTLFFTFPRLYASSFSGFYLPLIIVLWLLMVRGISIELRSHVDNPVWRSFWDGLFFLGSAALAFFYGAAVANVMRGVPLDRNGYFFEALWTNFDPTNLQPGILDWYTVLVGLLTLCALTMHGASYVALKTTGELNARTRRISLGAWAGTVLLTLGAAIATFALRPHLISNFRSMPWGFVFPLIVLLGLAGAGYYGLGRDEPRTFASSTAYLVGMMAGCAFAVYPMVLPAVDPANSLTIHNSAAPHYGLIVGLIWWLIGMALAVLYFVLIYRLFRGKVSLEGEGY